ncbi:hypothetical protein Q1695_002900 [Nippostrongylus brasiliensis]|nr:hypothetical protein Q1695_002900 [Nippostrongylus brasiliensis]
MAVDGNDRRFNVDNTARLKSPLVSAPNVVLRSPQRHYDGRDSSPANRHSYHGTTASLTALMGRERFGSVQVPKRLSQPLGFSTQAAEIFAFNNIHTILEQISHRKSRARVFPSKNCLILQLYTPVLLIVGVQQTMQ